MEFKNMRPDAPVEHQQYEAWANDGSKAGGNSILSTVYMSKGIVKCSVKVQRYYIARGEFNSVDDAMVYCEQMVERLQSETKDLPKGYASEHALKIHQSGGYK